MRSTPAAPARSSPPRSPRPWTGSRKHPCQRQRWKTPTQSAASWARAPGGWTAARRRNHHPPQAGHIRQRPRLRGRTPAAARQPLRPDPVEASDVGETVDRRSVANPPSPQTPESRPGQGRAVSTWKRSSAASTMRRCGPPRRSRCATPTVSSLNVGGARVERRSADARRGGQEGWQQLTRRLGKATQPDRLRLLHHERDQVRAGRRP